MSSALPPKTGPASASAVFSAEPEAANQHPDGTHAKLLRIGRDRLGGQRAAEQPYELAALHSITCTAPASSIRVGIGAGPKIFWTPARRIRIYKDAINTGG